MSGTRPHLRLRVPFVLFGCDVFIVCVCRRTKVMSMSRENTGNSSPGMALDPLCKVPVLRQIAFVDRSEAAQRFPVASA